jgi:hypothetical protein
METPSAVLPFPTLYYHPRMQTKISHKLPYESLKIRVLMMSVADPEHSEVYIASDRQIYQAVKSAIP